MVPQARAFDPSLHAAPKVVYLKVVLFLSVVLRPAASCSNNKANRKFLSASRSVSSWFRRIARNCADIYISDISAKRVSVQFNGWSNERNCEKVKEAKLVFAGKFF